jgi:hypothetical protein
MLKSITALCAALALTGCGSVPGRFDNRALCTLNCDRAFVGILFGTFGVTLELAADDARELRRMREQARDAEELVRVVQTESARRASGKGL